MALQLNHKLVEPELLLLVHAAGVGGVGNEIQNPGPGVMDGWRKTKTPLSSYTYIAHYGNVPGVLPLQLYYIPHYVNVPLPLQLYLHNTLC